MCAGQLESENMLTGLYDNVEVKEDDVEMSLDLHLSPDKSQEDL